MKYRLSDETRLFDGRTLYRIIACRNIKTSRLDIKSGDKGGWVQSEDNLSQYGSCWLAGEAIACDSSKVEDNAIVKDYAILEGCAGAYDSAIVHGYAKVKSHARIMGGAEVFETSLVKDEAVVWGRSKVSGNATISGKAFIFGEVFGNACVSDAAIIHGKVYGSATVAGRVTVDKDSEVCENSFLSGEMFLNKTKIASTSERNLCFNFFNNKDSISLLSSENISPDFPELYIAPVNFIRKGGNNFITKGHLSISCADSVHSKFEDISAKSEANFVNSACSLFPPNMTGLPAKCGSLPEIYDFVENLDGDAYRLLALNFMSMLKKTNKYNSFSARMIEKEKELLLGLAQNYIFAQFVGILFWAHEPYVKSDKYSEWVNFLDSFINHCRLDLSTKKIIGISFDTVFYNEEMLHMVAKVCGFLPSWQKTQLQVFESLNQAVKLFC